VADVFSVERARIELFFQIGEQEGSLSSVGKGWYY